MLSWSVEANEETSGQPFLLQPDVETANSSLVVDYPHIFNSIYLTTTQGITNGLVNYWPVKSGVMADVVGLVKTTSNGSPKFTTDRFGNANDALLINSGTSTCDLPDGVYSLIKICVEFLHK
jgi:hypothetical protein